MVSCPFEGIGFEALSIALTASISRCLTTIVFGSLIFSTSIISGLFAEMHCVDAYRMNARITER